MFNTGRAWRRAQARGRGRGCGRRGGWPRSAPGPAAPSGPTAPGEAAAAAWQRRRWGEKPLKKGQTEGESGRPSRPPSDSPMRSVRGQPLRGRAGLQRPERPSHLRAVAAEHSPHSSLRVCVCLCVYVYVCVIHTYVGVCVYMCVCVYIYAGVNLSLFRGGETHWAGGGPLPHSRFTHIGTLVHTHTHTGHGHRAHTAPSSALRLAARAGGGGRRPPGSSSRSEQGTRGLSLPGGLLGALWLLLLSFLPPRPGFGLAVSRVHPPLPTAGSSAHTGPLSRGAGAGSAQSPAGLGFAEPQPRRASPARAARPPAPRVGSGPGSSRGGAAGGDLSPPRSRYLPPVGLKSVRPPLARCHRRTAPQEVPGEGRWRPCGVAGPGSGRWPPWAGASPPSEKAGAVAAVAAAAFALPGLDPRRRERPALPPAPPSQPSAFGAGGGWSQPQGRKRANKPPPVAPETTDRPGEIHPTPAKPWLAGRAARSSPRPPRRSAEHRLGSARSSPAALPGASGGRVGEKRPRTPFF